MKNNIQEAIENILGEDETIQLADGFENAFVGVARQFGKPFAVYDRTMCIAILFDQGMTLDEAEEYFQFNVEGSWVGENTPAFIEK